MVNKKFRGEPPTLNDYTSCILSHWFEPQRSLRLLNGWRLPHEAENTVYRYLIAISKLRLGNLTEQQGEGS